jgi:hypothetical protein
MDWQSSNVLADICKDKTLTDGALSLRSLSVKRFPFHDSVFDSLILGPMDPKADLAGRCPLGL